MSEPLLQVRALSTHFAVRGRGPAVRAVDGVSFDVRPGEVFGLVGESGSGKTTLGRSLLKLVQPTAGAILYRGRDLMPLRERELRPLRRELSLIFQDPNASLNPAMTIAQGVGHPLRIHGLVRGRDELRARVAEMLERVGLSPAGQFLDRYPDDVSGGQKQRLVIARALITHPSFVVADEPVAALDMSVRARVLELMLDLRRELGLTYLFITHDLATARFVCDRIGILYLGNLVEWGPTEEVFGDPKHPYTRALLDAIPRPDPARRNRAKRLPAGEMPDASRPPLGCRFHPRCPAAFAPCGWQGRDLVEWFERRWTTMDPQAWAREEAVTGPLHTVEAGVSEVRFPKADVPALVALLRARMETAAGEGIFAAVRAVDGDGGGVIVRFGEGPEPALQPVGGVQVACHLHGGTARDRDEGVPGS